MSPEAMHVAIIAFALGVVVGALAMLLAGFLDEE